MTQIKKFLKFIPVLSLVTLTPLVASAATNGLTDVIATINSLFKAILPVLIAFGVLYFIWGIVMYFIADGEEAKKNGKNRIIYGIIGLAVIVSIWGLVNILVVTFNLGNSSAPSGINVNGSTGTCTVLKNTSTFQDYLNYIVCVINGSVIPLIFTLAVVMFIWGVIKFFIINADEEAKRAQGKQYMLWGIIALAVMISIWGLVNIFGVTFNFPRDTLPHTAP